MCHVQVPWFLFCTFCNFYLFIYCIFFVMLYFVYFVYFYIVYIFYFCILCIFLFCIFCIFLYFCIFCIFFIFCICYYIDPWCHRGAIGWPKRQGSDVGSKHTQVRNGNGVWHVARSRPHEWIWKVTAWRDTISGTVESTTF